MKIHHLLLIILVASAMTIATTTYITDLGSPENYGQAADFTGLNNTIEAMDKVINTSEALENDITSFVAENPSVGGVLSIPYKFLQSGWKMIKLMWQSFETVDAITKDVTSTTAESVGITLPGWVGGMVMAMVTITLAAIIIFAWFKWRVED